MLLKAELVCDNSFIKVPNIAGFSENQIALRNACIYCQMIEVISCPNDVMNVYIAFLSCDHTTA